MIRNKLTLWRHMDYPVAMTLWEVSQTSGRRRVDLSDCTAYFVVENEAGDGYLVNAQCSIDGDPTQGRIIWEPDGTEFNGLTYDSDQPKRVRCCALVVNADGTRLFPVYGAYAEIWPDIPLL